MAETNPPYSFPSTFFPFSLPCPLLFPSPLHPFFPSFRPFHLSAAVNRSGKRVSIHFNSKLSHTAKLQLLITVVAFYQLIRTSRWCCTSASAVVILRAKKMSSVAEPEWHKCSAPDAQHNIVHCTVWGHTTTVTSIGIDLMDFFKIFIFFYSRVATPILIFIVEQRRFREKD